MSPICRHTYPRDLCGVCTPPAKKKAGPTPETDAKQKLKDIIGEEYVPAEFARRLERERDELREKYAKHHAEAEKLTQIIRAATVLIAAKGRHNTMLAYEELRSALSPDTPPALQ